MTSRVRGSARIGTQGWNYPAWVGPFFPDGTRATDFLRLYARAFDTVEVDSTFYAIPPVSTVRGWANRTPDGFTFALKLPQEISHERRFINATDTLLAFVDRVRELGPKLGPILIQCGPDFSPNERDALAMFLEQLPREVQFAIEFRQQPWISKGTLAMLKQHDVALALSDGKWIPREWLLKLCAQPTANFTYVRWMGPDRSITDYSRIQVDRSAELDAWATMLPTLLAQVRTVYGFANNHFAGHGPQTARMIQTRLGIPTIDPRELGEQTTLF